MALDNAPTVDPVPAPRSYLSSAVDALLVATVVAIAALTFATMVVL